MNRKITEIIPTEIEKKINNEFTTPFNLRQEMLDKITPEFWKTPKRVLEPCSGKGGFLADIVEKFMNGLRYVLPDEEKRMKCTLEYCLFFADINPENIKLNKLLLDPDNKYNLNAYTGDTLDMVFESKFDLVIGNPPFSVSQIHQKKKGGGGILWNKFVKAALESWVKPDGLFLFVHPPGWRKPESTFTRNRGLFEKMAKENQMIYLEIHDAKDGMKTFKCGTRYDFYLIEKTKCYKETIVRDIKGEMYKTELRNWNWLPNCQFEEIKKLVFTNEKCEVIHDSAYEQRKKCMSKTESESFIYPCVHSTPKSGIRYMYSNTNKKGHFGIPKVIFGETGVYNAINDYKGVYGMTQGCIGIVIETEEQGDEVIKFLKSDKFKKILKSCSWSNYMIDWRFIRDLKKDLNDLKK